MLGCGRKQYVEGGCVGCVGYVGYVGYVLYGSGGLWGSWGVRYDKLVGFNSNFVSKTL